MDLSEIREKFRDLSGRYDLVTANGTDEGADFFINAGQRWLDRQLDFQGASAVTTLSLSTDAYSASVNEVRAIKNVGITQDSDDFDFLVKTGYEGLKRHTMVADSSDSDEPRWYAFGRDAPGSRGNFNQEILIWPPTDAQRTLLVEGLFASTELSNDGDESFWSVNFPDILVKATMFKAEAFQRNTSGEQDFRQSLLDDLRGIDHDEVEEMIGDIERVRNSWRDIVV